MQVEKRRMIERIYDRHTGTELDRQKQREKQK